MGHSPDCVDRAVPDDVDVYPEGTLPSEPIFTDDMTYQEKIEALNGTMYDYDDVCDNSPDYYRYNLFQIFEDNNETINNICKSNTQKLDN